MHITVVATDFDGTVSRDGELAPEAARALRHLRETGLFTVLVSGRPFEFLRDLQAREQAFDLIVAENGSALYDPRTDEMRIPFGEVCTELLDMLERLGVPLWRGMAAAGTTAPYDDAVWVASRELSRAVHVEANRDEVMLLPPGASKGAGLLLLLKSEGLSPRNLLAFGDAENDASLLNIAEVKIAVANAVDTVRAMADYVTPDEGPAGVAHFIDRYLLGRQPFDFAVRGAHHFGLGSAAGIDLNAHDLVDRNVLIAGGSGYGKTWLASQLADGLVGGGYQVLALDPVGDLRSLRRHATCLCLGLGGEEMPPIGLIVQLVAETDLSLVLDLSQMATSQEQVLYAAGLLRRVSEVHRRFGKPHWIVVDEAQDLVGGHSNPAVLPLLRDARLPGVCLVTWQPSRLEEALLERIDGVVLTHHRLRLELDCLGRWLEARGLEVTQLADRLDALTEGQALVWGLTPTSDHSLVDVAFQLGPSTFPHMQRLQQYLEDVVAPAKQFYFTNQTGYVAPAGNLGELIDRLRTIDLTALTYHFERGDFSRWIRNVLHDETLARWLDRVQSANLSGEALREALLDAFEQRRRILERLI